MTTSSTVGYGNQYIDPVVDRCTSDFGNLQEVVKITISLMKINTKQLFHLFVLLDPPPPSASSRAASSVFCLTHPRLSLPSAASLPRSRPDNELATVPRQLSPHLSGVHLIAFRKFGSWQMLGILTVSQPCPSHSISRVRKLVDFGCSYRILAVSAAVWVFGPVQSCAPAKMFLSFHYIFTSPKNFFLIHIQRIGF